MTAAIKSRAVGSKAGRGRPPLVDTENYRRAILEVTAAVFLEKGYQKASTNLIARRARTSKQTLYALYSTKAELFVAVITAHMEKLFTRHEYFIASGEPPRQVLTDIGRMVLGMFRSPEFLTLYRIMVAEVKDFPEVSRRLWRECRERGYGLLTEYLKSCRIGGPNYRKSAEQFISLVLSDFVLNAMLDPELTLSNRAVGERVRESVAIFLHLHKEPARRR